MEQAQEDRGGGGRAVHIGQGRVGSVWPQAETTPRTGAERLAVPARPPGKHWACWEQQTGLRGESASISPGVSMGKAVGGVDSSAGCGVVSGYVVPGMRYVRGSRRLVCER